VYLVSDGSFATGLTFATASDEVYVIIDGAAPVAADNDATEIGSTGLFDYPASDAECAAAKSYIGVLLLKAAGATARGSYSVDMEPDLETPVAEIANDTDTIISLLGSSSGTHATCPLGSDIGIGDMVLEARLGGTAGNDLTFTVVTDTVFSITESGNDVTLHLPDEPTKFSHQIEALINSDSTLVRVKTNDSNPDSSWLLAGGGPYPFDGGADESAGILDANVVEWKGVAPLDLDGAFRVQASMPFGLADFAAAVWNALSELSETYGDQMRINRSVLAGQASGFDTGTISFKAADGSTIRLVVITATTGRTASTPGTLSP
jgi:hypothetical protein